MAARRALIPQRRRIFFGCEGVSERSYGQYLQLHADDLGLHLYLDTVIARGGSPLAVVDRCVNELHRRKIRQGRFRHRAILLDRDRLGESPGDLATITKLAQQHGLNVIWQNENHEAFLLRHFPDCQSLRPSGDRSETELRRRWPEYQKPMSARQLFTRLPFVCLANVCCVENDLARFLSDLGFLIPR